MTSTLHSTPLLNQMEMMLFRYLLANIINVIRIIIHFSFCKSFQYEDVRFNRSFQTSVCFFQLTAVISAHRHGLEFHYISEAIFSNHIKF